MIQLYSLATPNGQKVSIALEEMKIPYEAHTINIIKGDQFTDEYIAISPNSKIPAIVDSDGPGGTQISIMESCAILMYLADKSGTLISTDPVLRNETMQWLFFQAGHVGPMFGQFGHFFVYAKDSCDHPYPVERYAKETKRLLSVLEERLSTSEYIIADGYSIADIAIFPWVSALSMFYKAQEELELDEYAHVNAWLQKCMERPAVTAGMKVCPF
jgi:GST-like protein